MNSGVKNEIKNKEARNREIILAEDFHTYSVEAENKNKNFAFDSYQTNERTDFIVDSRATSHMCCNFELFSGINFEENGSVVIANGNQLQSKGIGEINIEAKISNGDINNVKLQEVLFVPELENNLLSVRKITGNGYSVIFENDKCSVVKGDSLALEAYSNHNLYKVNLKNKYECVNMESQCNS